MFLGTKTLPLNKYYRLLMITKDQFSLYANALTYIDIIVKTSNDIYYKKLKINSANNTITSLDSVDIGTFKYIADNNFIYLYFKPSYSNRTIFISADNGNVTTFFDNEVKDYDDNELSEATEVNVYKDLSGSSFVNTDVTGRYVIKAIDNDKISINLVVTVASDLAAGNRTLLSAINMPSKTPFVIHGSTTDGKHISVQYDSNNNIKIPSSVGAIAAGTYYVDGIIN